MGQGDLYFNSFSLKYRAVELKHVEDLTIELRTVELQPCRRK